LATELKKGQINVEVFFERMLGWCEDGKKTKTFHPKGGRV